MAPKLLQLLLLSLPMFAFSTELPWDRVVPGARASGCDAGHEQGERTYWLHDGRRLAAPTDRFWEPGAYVCVHEGPRGVRVAKALLVQGGPAEDACWPGEPAANSSRERRVADGVRARHAPWVAQVLLDGRFVCGCSLVGQRWALTAAHCLAGEGTAFSVALGPLRPATGPRIGVVRTLPHPSYRRGTRAHDIALLALETSSTERLAVVCLPPGPGFLERFSQGLLFGWGKVGPGGGPARRLQEAILPLVGRDRCEAALPDIGPQAFCAGFGEAYRADACSGDSGGPLVALLDQRPVLVGVVSWGRACSRPHTFGVYTRVDSYLPWIRAHLRGSRASEAPRGVPPVCPGCPCLTGKMASNRTDSATDELAQAT
ncbi:unnamed protein product [Ixodes hexagonus]